MAIPMHTSKHFDSDVIKLAPGHQTAITAKEIQFAKNMLHVGDQIYTYRRPRYALDAPMWDNRAMYETIISIHPNFIRTNKQCMVWADVVMSLRRRLHKSWLEPRKISVQRY